MQTLTDASDLLSVDAPNPVERHQACRNCAAALVGPYCHACGEDAAQNQLLPLRGFLAQTWDEFVGVDSRLFRTLRLLITKPGALTVAYLDGHRQRYVRPLRLYLVTSALFFIVIAWVQPYGFDAVNIFDQLETQGKLADFEKVVAQQNLTLEQYGERFSRLFNNAFSIAMFFALPGVAVLLTLLYLSQGRLFHGHVVFVLNYVTFSFLANLVALPFESLHQWLYVAIAMAISYPYLLLAMKRVYKERWGQTLWKFGMFVVGYFLVNFICILFAMFYALLAAMGITLSGLVMKLLGAA